MDFFDRQWSTYRRVVDHDLMEHQALSAATTAAIEGWLAQRPPGLPQPHMVDLGCGDLALLAPLLRQAMTARAVDGERHAGEWVDVGTPARLAALDAGLADREDAPRDV